MSGDQRETSIEDYAPVGDCRTLALVSRFGSIDWCCIPEFPSPSVFAALLDRERGGQFAMTPRGIARAMQQYLPRTNVLLTRIECEGGVLELTDFMTLPDSYGGKDGMQEIVRIATCVAGSVALDVRFAPRPDYARMPPRLQPAGPRHWHCGPPEGCFELRTSFAQSGNDDGLSGCVAMRAGDVHAAVLVTPAGHGSPADPLVPFARQRLAATVGWWRSWCDACTYRGAHADVVLRSALALKLLTHGATGALVAAGTTSIPESETTGARNWDYRYCWLRDSSLVFNAFTELGYTRESGAFLQWLLHATHRTRPRLQLVYDMYGGHDLREHVLPELRGYHGIGPVRVGNDASNQRQNDVYGEVITTAHDWVRRGGRLEKGEKELVASFARMACDVWRTPDNGIWEIRSAPRHNTHSKLMCWAALERTLRIDAMQPLPVDAVRMRRERDAIRDDIEAHAWNASLGSYVGFYGSDTPDASLLLMPRLGYLDAHDARMRGTVRCIQQRLSLHGLLFRFPPGKCYDGVEGGENLFAICSFWLVDCLAREGRIDEAHALYERLVSLRTPAGLYAEEFDARTGRAAGNFPQAFSHVGSITAALSLQAASSANGTRSFPA